MKSSKTRTPQSVGVMTVIVTAIAATYAICSHADVRAESPECEAHEVFRWSDRTCYVPQGE